MELTTEIESSPKSLTERIEEINAIQGDFATCARSAANWTVQGANRRRELGIKLKALREAKDSDGHLLVPHGKWQFMFADRGKSQSGFTFDFTYQTGVNYIAFADKHPNEITDISQIVRDQRPMLEDAGVIEHATRLPGSQNEQPEGQRWLTAVQRAWESVTHKVEKKPIEQWSEIDRASLKTSLKPMAELYATL